MKQTIINIFTAAIVALLVLVLGDSNIRTQVVALTSHQTINRNQSKDIAVGNGPAGVVYLNPTAAQSGNTNVSGTQTNNGVNFNQSISPGGTNNIYANLSGDTVINATGSLAFLANGVEQGRIEYNGGTISTTGSSGTVEGFMPPVYNVSGSQGANTEHMVALTGNLSSSALTSCGIVTGYCEVITLSGAAAFSSGGSSSAPPSFGPSGGWNYQSNGLFVALINGGASVANGMTLFITAGIPNTLVIYGQATVSGSPFYIPLEGS